MKGKTQTLWKVAKAVQRGNFVAIQSYLRKQEKISDKQPNLTHKTMREKGTNKMES